MDRLLQLNQALPAPLRPAARGSVEPSAFAKASVDRCAGAGCQRRRTSRRIGTRGLVGSGESYLDAGKKRKTSPPFPQNGWRRVIRLLDESRKSSSIIVMKVSLPLKEMTVSEKIGIMEEIWSDLSSVHDGYSPPDWHGRILDERSRLAESGEVGFTDWETAKKQIRDRVS